MWEYEVYYWRDQKEKKGKEEDKSEKTTRTKEKVVGNYKKSEGGPGIQEWDVWKGHVTVDDKTEIKVRHITSEGSEIVVGLMRTLGI